MKTESLLTRLDNLILQAETEKSHYYTASVLKECREIILGVCQAEVDKVVMKMGKKKFLRVWEETKAKNCTYPKNCAMLLDGYCPRCHEGMHP